MRNVGLDGSAGQIRRHTHERTIVCGAQRRPKTERRELMVLFRRELPRSGMHERNHAEALSGWLIGRMFFPPVYVKSDGRHAGVSNNLSARDVQ